MPGAANLGCAREKACRPHMDLPAACRQPPSKERKRRQSSLLPIGLLRDARGESQRAVYQTHRRMGSVRLTCWARSLSRGCSCPRSSRTMPWSGACLRPGSGLVAGLGSGFGMPFWPPCLPPWSCAPSKSFSRGIVITPCFHNVFPANRV